jgi:soluble cytochrome b562
MLFRVASFLAIVAFISPTLQAKDKSEDDVKFNAKFRTFSFKDNIRDIVYLEGKEYKPIDIYDGTFGAEKIYNGGAVIEFFKVVIEKSPNESDLAKAKVNELQEKEKKVGDDYNQMRNEMSAYARTITNPESTTASQKARLNEYQEALDALKVKIDEAREKTYNETQRMYAKEKAGRDVVNLSNNSTKKPLELPKPNYEPFAKFPIPASGGNYILIFNKTPNGLTISPLNDAPGLFPFGSYQFFNFTGTTVELRFGSKVIPLNPNGRTVFKPETANGEYLEGEFWTKVDDEFKLGYKFRNLHISRIRTLAFIMPTAPGQSALNLKIAEERGQAEPPPADNSKSKDKKAKESEKKESENRPFG